jgi:small subunit ribosomal protein S20
MPQTKAAKKSQRQTAKRTQRNRAVKARIRTAVRKLRLAVSESREADAQLAYREAVSLLDKAREKGVLHANNVSRRKSRLTRLVNTLDESLDEADAAGD